MDYFVDSHCHMFTIADVPLYNSIYQFTKKKDKIHNKLMLPFAGIFLPFADFTEQAQKYERYIRFFEQESKVNAQQLVDEALKLVLSVPVDGLTTPTLVLTPLVMDFDCGGEVEKLEAQVARLQQAISETKSESQFKIYPFLGLDPSRSNYIALLDKYGLTKERAAPSQNGNFIGVKLYPPLGFCAGDSAHNTFYRELINRNLPITVHCQRDSFRLTPDDAKYTQPSNWVKLLEKEEFHNMRINFAHFGGEDEVAKTIEFTKNDGNTAGRSWQFDVDGDINKDSWTYSIVRMLKRYPNTYADVAAFDVNPRGDTSRKAIASLHWLLYLDGKKHFDVVGEENCKLVTKLLWGSDYPMTLGDASTNYKTIFNEFFKELVSPTDNIFCDYPPMDYNPAELMKQMVCDNPKKFLGLP